MLVDGTMAGDTPGRECLREDGNWRPRAGETRLAGVSVGGGDAGLPHAGETLGKLFHDTLGPLEHSVLNNAGPVGRHVAVGPVGLDETLQVLDPLEHSGPDHGDPAGQRAAVGPVGLFGMLSQSDCHTAGPAGPYVAGGPVGPDDMLQVLDPLEHSVLDHADPVGQRADVGPVGLFGMLSPSDCHPAGPAGPYVVGDPVGPHEEFQVLDLLEDSVPDHADPAGQHAVFQDVLEPLEHSVLDTALDGRPMEGFPVLGPIEHSVLKMTPDGGHSAMTIDEEPLVHSVLDVALDGRPMEGIPVLEPLEHSVPVGALDSGLMEGMSHLEPLEHSVLSVARGDWSGKKASVFEPLEHSVLMMTLDDGPLEKMSDDEPLKHSVLDAALNSRPIAGAPVLPLLQCSAMAMGLVRRLLTEDAGPPFGPDHDLTLSDGPHATGIVDRISDGSVLLPAVDVGRVAWSSADGRYQAGDGNTDGCITMGFQRWNTEVDVQDQYETFNGMPVYYGSDLYDSDDSDCDDPYALASAAYVEDYNFDCRMGWISWFIVIAGFRIVWMFLYSTNHVYLHRFSRLRFCVCV